MIETPILIVGGGPVGLTLGIDLAHRGQPSLLVEERTGPMPHPKATLLGSRSMELLRRWNLDGPIFDAAVPNDHPYYIIFTTRLAGQELHRFRSPSIDEGRYRDPAALQRFRELQWSPYSKTQIGQQALEPVLVDHARALPKLEMRHGWRLQSFEQHDDHVAGQIVLLQDAKVTQVGNGFGGALRRDDERLTVRRPPDVREGQQAG